MPVLPRFVVLREVETVDEYRELSFIKEIGEWWPFVTFLVSDRGERSYDESPWP